MIVKLVRDPINVGWSLRSRTTTGSKIGILGWTCDDSSVDAGIPEAIANVLSKALCHCSQVSFLDPSSSSILKPSPFKSMLGQPVFSIRTTSQQEIVARLFYIDEFPWDQCSQVVILSKWKSEPIFNYANLFELWSHPAPNLNSLANRMKVLGYLLPGPDGDFVEIVIFDNSLLNLLTQNLANECKQRGLGWQEVSENQFRETKWVVHSKQSPQL